MNARWSFECNFSIILDKYQPAKSFPTPSIKPHGLLRELQAATPAKRFMVFPRPEAREKGGWRGGWPTARGTSGRWDRRGRRRSTGERRRGGQRGRGLLRPCRALGKLEMGREVAVPEKSSPRERRDPAPRWPRWPRRGGYESELAISVSRSTGAKSEAPVLVHRDRKTRDEA